MLFLFNKAYFKFCRFYNYAFKLNTTFFKHYREQVYFAMNTKVTENMNNIICLKTAL